MEERTWYLGDRAHVCGICHRASAALFAMEDCLVCVAETTRAADARRTRSCDRRVVGDIMGLAGRGVHVVIGNATEDEKGVSPPPTSHHSRCLIVD